MGSSECGFRIADFGVFIRHSTFCIPQLKDPLNPIILFIISKKRENVYWQMWQALHISSYHSLTK